MKLSVIKISVKESKRKIKDFVIKRRGKIKDFTKENERFSFYSLLYIWLFRGHQRP